MFPINFLGQNAIILYLLPTAFPFSFKAEKEIDYLRTFKDGQADGVILAGTVFTDEHREVLASMPIPVVIAGQDLDGYCSVYHDDYHAMYDMTRAMAGAGRRNLAFLGVAMQDVAAGKRRYEGYRDAVIDAGLSQSADRHLTAAFSVASGYEKAAELIGKYPDVDGIVCATDEIAAGAIRLLRARGIDVPEHILLSGVGDSDLAGIAGKSMMTIHYHYEKCGEIAASSLLGQILGKPVADKIMLGYELCCN